MGIVEVRDLVKTYSNGVNAVKGITFNIDEGEIFGMVGPNGAGKTTTIKMITTLTSITSGKAMISGIDVSKHPDDIRKIIGIVPQDLSIDDDLHGIENLILAGMLYGMSRSDARKKALELLDFFDLTGFKDKDASGYSGGMKKRLDLACGLMHEPKILFLDEPTLGLDTQTRAKIWEYVQKLNTEHKITIFLTTHYLEEADRLCNRISIVDLGKIVAMDTPANLKASVGKSVVTLKAKGDNRALIELLNKSEYVSETKEFKDEVKATLNDMNDVTSLLEKIYKNNIKLERININEPTLDDTFIHYTGSALRDREEKADTMAMRRAVRRMRQ